MLPLDDRLAERFNPDLAGRPELIKGNPQLLFGGMGRLGETSSLNLKNKSHAVTAEVVVPEAQAEGVIIAQGGGFGGWSPLRQGRKAQVLLQLAGLQRFYTEAARRCRPASTRCAWSSPTTAAGWPRAAPLPCIWTATRSAKGGSRCTQPLFFSLDETLDVGCETGSMVAEDYTARTSKFNGKINWVQLDQGADDHDHLISPEERLHVAMRRQ